MLPTTARSLCEPSRRWRGLPRWAQGVPGPASTLPALVHPLPVHCTGSLCRVYGSSQRTCCYSGGRGGAHRAQGAIRKDRGNQAWAQPRFCLRWAGGDASNHSAILGPPPATAAPSPRPVSALPSPGTDFRAGAIPESRSPRARLSLHVRSFHTLTTSVFKVGSLLLCIV